jgi:hypothetical protein
MDPNVKAIRAATVAFKPSSIEGKGPVIMTDTRGNVGLDLLQMEADHYAPYQWAPGQWISNTRGNLPAEDPEVQAVIARMRGA